jgi:DNA-3-methyladenine glycosylase
MKALPRSFYERPLLELAPALIGCVVEHAGCAGVIVETEAYHESEPACHAFAGLTPRTEVLFGEPGIAYVYRSYGIHALLNAVCEPQGVGAAVLIRALAPIEGLEQMRQRRGPIGGRAAPDRELCSGPGKLTQALGIGLAQNGTSLSRGPVRIGPRPGSWSEPSIAVGTRIGISRAVELEWRFCAAGDVNVSRPQPRGRASAGPDAEPQARPHPRPHPHPSPRARGRRRRRAPIRPG